LPELDWGCPITAMLGALARFTCTLITLFTVLDRSSVSLVSPATTSLATYYSVRIRRPSLPAACPVTVAARLVIGAPWRSRCSLRRYIIATCWASARGSFQLRTLGLRLSVSSSPCCHHRSPVPHRSCSATVNSFLSELPVPFATFYQAPLKVDLAYRVSARVDELRLSEIDTTSAGFDFCRQPSRWATSLSSREEVELCRARTEGDRTPLPRVGLAHLLRTCTGPRRA